MKRIAWIDVLKFLGIVSIYFWHLGEGLGRSYEFILRYHVPLFFFISGCTEALQKQTSFVDYAKKKVKMVLVPFFFFAVISMFLVIIYEKCNIELIKLMLKQIVYGGLRNQIFAYSLWFLTCLFVMSILFQLIKCLKKRSLIFIAGIILYVFAARFMPYKPNMVPMIPYNADCALYYLVYYCTGYCVFPKLQEFLQKEGKKKSIVVAGTGVAGGIYAGFLFVGMDLLSVLEKIPVVRIMHPFVTAILLIWVNLVVALLLQKWRFLQKIGEETLYLCGSEFLIKTLAIGGLSFLGIGIDFTNPIIGMGYVLILLLLVHFLLVPVEKWMHNKIINFS
ncbi:MAG: acyltransferase family protein [Lachnospiraceae bacterium]|nr:acyltransferase family protein [Lachnospiraceae bacterium]